ncbi:hypothetical protein GCM10009860_18750 [Microbacterium mitrae]|uniref:DUF3558 domain-containing protein n=1 Tax=Microbacterium mitrae TaxID=664640 RepID=A0A5C8HP72_9MICO|nr:hypothetical protein [Microbacterium mitrae]TXK04594.1 hypothetical protein FVP60_07900 [Microbacterium mitrae]
MSRMRNIVIVVFGAVLLLTGCTGTPQPTQPTQTSAASETTAPEPSSSPEQPTPVVYPFNGDCSQALSPALIEELGGLSEEYEASPAGGEIAAMLDAIVAVGGLRCGYGDPTAGGGSHLLVLLPAAMYTDEVRNEWADALSRECTSVGHNTCISFAEGSSLVAMVTTAPEDAELLERIAADFVQTAAASGVVPTGAELEPWGITCEDIGRLVLKATGWSDLTVGYSLLDVDSPYMAAMFASPSLRPCHWRSADQDPQKQGTIATMLQRGVGAPSEESLASANAEPITLAGADSAWRTQNAAGQLTLIAVVGNDRISVRVTAAPDAPMDSQQLATGVMNALISAAALG